MRVFQKQVLYSEQGIFEAALMAEPTCAASCQFLGLLFFLIL